MGSRLITGIDVERQEDDRERFDVAEDGEVSGPFEKQDETAQSVGIFAQLETPLTQRLLGTLGVRYDNLRMKIDDKLQDPEDFSDDRTFREVSGLAGLSYEVVPNHRAYANVSTAFESPTFTEFANPEPGAAGFNPDLEEQESTTYEVGFKGATQRLRYDAALYRSNLRNELIPLDVDERDFFQNAGRTRRWGLELSAEYIATEHLRLNGAYSHQDFKYQKFEDDEGNDFAGNRLPGIPRNQLFGEARYSLSEGRYAAVEGLWIDRLFAEDPNDVEIGSHQVFNARVGTESMKGPWLVQTFVAVNNITNEQYFSNIRINASGNRFYEPAPERNVFAGVTIRPGG